MTELEVASRNVEKKFKFALWERNMKQVELAHILQTSPAQADRANAINAGGNYVQSQSAPSSTAQPTSSSSTGNTYIDNFKNGGDRFVLQGTMVNNHTELQNGIYQSEIDELTADPFDWTDNGIPTKLLDDLSDPAGRSFNDGATVRFKAEYQRGTIDKYLPNVGDNGAVGIDFLDGNGIIWFDAKKFWEHA